MIIITGGAGFIGSGLIAGLNEQGVSDILVVDALGHSGKWSNLVGKQYTDYCDKDSFLDYLHKNPKNNKTCKAIIHLGACSQTTEQDASFLMSNNTLYTRNLAAYSLENHIPFYYASSAATYGEGYTGFDDDEEELQSLRPINMYGYSKHLFDLWAKEFGWLNKITGFKFFNVFGPNEAHKTGMTSIVYNAYHQIKSQGFVKLFQSDHPDYKDGEQLRDFVYVKDVVRTLLWFLDHPEHKGLFNLGFGTATTWNRIVGLVFKAMHTDPNIQYIPMPENLKGKYQYFTEANMNKLLALDAPEQNDLEKSVEDYVKNHLMKDKPW